MRCKKCGQELEEDSAFCSNCGMPAAKKNKGYVVIAVIVSLVIVVGIGILYATIHVDKKEQITSEKVTEKKSIKKKSAKKETSTVNSYQNNKMIKNEPEDIVNNEYVIEDSATRILTDSDIQGLTAKELNYAKNEIFARHGRKFDSQELRDYFESKSWYVGEYEGNIFDSNYSDQVLSEIEKKNAEFLKNAENKAQSGGYQLDQ